MFGMNGTGMNASRAGWLLLKGPINGGLFVCHKCLDSRCVNPDHMYLGTQRENMQDAARLGRMSGPKRRTSNRLMAQAPRPDPIHPEPDEDDDVSPNVIAWLNDPLRPRMKRGETPERALVRLYMRGWSLYDIAFCIGWKHSRAVKATKPIRAYRLSAKMASASVNRLETEASV
jgi:hypothetical protein